MSIKFIKHQEEPPERDLPGLKIVSKEDAENIYYLVPDTRRNLSEKYCYLDTFIRNQIKVIVLDEMTFHEDFFATLLSIKAYNRKPFEELLEDFKKFMDSNVPGFKTANEILKTRYNLTYNKEK